MAISTKTKIASAGILVLGAGGAYYAAGPLSSDATTAAQYGTSTPVALALPVGKDTTLTLKVVNATGKASTAAVQWIASNKAVTVTALNTQRSQVRLHADSDGVTSLLATWDMGNRQTGYAQYTVAAGAGDIAPWITTCGPTSPACWFEGPPIIETDGSGFTWKFGDGVRHAALEVKRTAVGDSVNFAVTMSVTDSLNRTSSHGWTVRGRAATTTDSTK